MESIKTGGVLTPEEVAQIREIGRKRRERLAPVRGAVLEALRVAVVRCLDRVDSSEDIETLTAVYKVYSRVSSPDDDLEEAVLKAAAAFGERATTPSCMVAFSELADYVLNFS